MQGTLPQHSPVGLNIYHCNTGPLRLQTIVPAKVLQQVEEALQRGPEALANLPVQAGAVAGAVPAAVGQPGAAGGAGGIPEGVPAAGRPTDPGRLDTR